MFCFSRLYAPESGPTVIWKRFCDRISKIAIIQEYVERSRFWTWQRAQTGPGKEEFCRVLVGSESGCRAGRDYKMQECWNICFLDGSEE